MVQFQLFGPTVMESQKLVLKVENSSGLEQKLTKVYFLDEQVAES
jgi:hypothetical protein